MKIKTNIYTKLVHGNMINDERTGAVSYPIYQTATFSHPELYETTGYDYSRLQNPTREKLENTISILEHGSRTFAFSSGMAAIATLFELIETNTHIIISDDIYGGTYRFFEEVLRKRNISISYVDTSSISCILENIRTNTSCIFLETPTNPMMKISDIRKISDITKENGLLFIVDNTFLTPYLQNPLILGADAVIHSGTKYLSGHNDTLSGFITVKDEKLTEKLALYYKTIGSCLSPFDSWLVLRGIKTLGIRMDRQQQNALKIAKYLEDNVNVERVYYPGLTSHIGYDLNLKQSSGFGGMISFYVKNKEHVEKVLRKIKIIVFAESLGGVESLITYPLVQTHNAIPIEMREKIGINEKLLRLSVGIEDSNDLINDLDNALR